MPTFTPALVEPRLVAGLDADGEQGHAGDRIRLAASSCGACGRTVFPAHDRCPGCGAEATSIALGCEGRIRGFTSVLAPPPDALIDPPYHVGLVDFDGGVTIMGLLVSETAVGAVVETVTFEVGDRLTYAFRAVGG